MTERNAIKDFASQKKIILGGCNVSEVKKIYKKVFLRAKIYETDSNTAELTKFVINCFLATKVSFFNEMYQICDKMSIDYNQVIKLVLTDKRIGESHVSVPGFDGHLGHGGSCFPNNVNILIHEMLKLGIKPTMLQATREKNLEVRPEQDWLLLKGRTVLDD